VSYQDSSASFQQAKLIMQAGINLSVRGEVDDALTLFGNAEHRFKKLKQWVDAGIARGWINALKKHQAENADSHVAAVR
jgi:hypothetical protein